MTTLEDDSLYQTTSSPMYNYIQSSATPVQVSTPRCFYPTNSSASNPLDFEVPSDYFNMYSFITADDTNSLSSPLSPTTLSPLINHGKYFNINNNQFQSQQTNTDTNNSNRLDDLNDMALDEVLLTQQSFVYPSLPMEPLVSVPILTSNTQQQYNIQTQKPQLEQQQQQQQPIVNFNTPTLFKIPQHNHSTSISSNHTTNSTLVTTSTSKSNSDIDELDDDLADEDLEDYDDEDYDYETSNSRRRNTIGYTIPIGSKRNSSVSSTSSHPATSNRRMSKNAKMFKCDSCSSSFTRKTRLTEHKNRVHLGKVYHFECKICGVRLSSKENLTRHKIVHTDKFKCDKCDRRFDRSYRFHRHIEKCDGST